MTPLAKTLTVTDNDILRLHTQPSGNRADHLELGNGDNVCGREDVGVAQAIILEEQSEQALRTCGAVATGRKMTKRDRHWAGRYARNADGWRTVARGRDGGGRAARR